MHDMPQSFDLEKQVRMREAVPAPKASSSGLCRGFSAQAMLAGGKEQANLGRALDSDMIFVTLPSDDRHCFLPTQLFVKNVSSENVCACVARI